MSITARRLLQVKMKTIRKKFLRLLSILCLGLVYNEFLVYYLVLLGCSYPEPPLSSSASPVMILADTHLLGSRLGHWADKLRREWQMFRAFQTAQTLFSPEHVFFLGLVCQYLLYCNHSMFQEICLTRASGVHPRSLITTSEGFTLCSMCQPTPAST